MSDEKQYFELGEETDTIDIVDFFNERLNGFNLMINPKFYLQANKKQKKQLIKISKIPEQYQEKMKADILVQINPTYFDEFTSSNPEYIDNLNEILFDQEIDKIEINPKNGKISIKQKSIRASRGIIEKFNYEDVVRAQKIEEEIQSQKDDQENN